MVSISGADDPSTLPGFVVAEDGRRLGVATFRLSDTECELITLDAMDEGRGVGTRLLAAVKLVADTAACRLWLITTNENIEAIRFYQRRGMDMRASPRFHRVGGSTQAVGRGEDRRHRGAARPRVLLLGRAEHRLA